MTSGAFDYDWRLRVAALAELKGLASLRGGVVSTEELTAGFRFEGERIRFWDPRRGIWRPKQLGSQGAALTIVTTPPRPGKTPPYDDQVASDAESLLYRYEGTDPDHWTNRAVRRAYHDGRPLIYLYGIRPGLYCTGYGRDCTSPFSPVSSRPTSRTISRFTSWPSPPVGS